LPKSTNRQTGGTALRIDFDQIDPLERARLMASLKGRTPKVFLVAVDDADFAGADFPVDARERGGRGKGTGRERATQEALTGSNMFMYASTIFHQLMQYVPVLMLAVVAVLFSAGTLAASSLLGKRARRSTCQRHGL
jgi:hypothetical protein